MVTTLDKFKDIHYQKITWEEFDKLTPEVIKDICQIDNLFRRKPDDLKNYLTHRKEEKARTIFYLMYNGNVLLGCTIGHLKKVSELYNIKKNPNANCFHLTETFINPLYEGKGLGALLIERVVADQRAKYGSKFIYLSANLGVQKITARITGKNTFIIKITDKEATKEILRSFKYSKFKYDLITIPENRENPGPSKKQYIQINENPNYKKREIRSRVK